MPYIWKFFVYFFEISGKQYFYWLRNFFIIFQNISRASSNFGNFLKLNWQFSAPPNNLYKIPVRHVQCPFYLEIVNNATQKKICHANFNCYHHTSSKLKHSQYCQMKVFQDGKSRWNFIHFIRFVQGHSTEATVSGCS